MKFCMDSYREMLLLLKDRGYRIVGYTDEDIKEKHVVLRHDVDMSLEYAREMAKVEYELGIKATYFILVTSDFYNIHSKKSQFILQEIVEMGHDIGLHFDESVYDADWEQKLMLDAIYKERQILSAVVNKAIGCVSMHTPSKAVIEQDIKIEDLINAYAKKYMKDYKYISDSKMHYREDVLDVITHNKYKKLHILTHPIWYRKEEQPHQDIIFTMLVDKLLNKFNYLNDIYGDLGVYSFERS